MLWSVSVIKLTEKFERMPQLVWQLLIGINLFLNNWYWFVNIKETEEMSLNVLTAMLECIKRCRQWNLIEKNWNNYGGIKDCKIDICEGYKLILHMTHYYCHEYSGDITILL